MVEVVRNFKRLVVRGLVFELKRMIYNSMAKVAGWCKRMAVAKTFI